MRVILASRSPRRIDILERLGVDLVVVPADIDEHRRPGETALEMVVRLATEKARTVDARRPDGTADLPVVAADTTVEVGDEILGQPDDDAHAAWMLKRLSGRTHRVHTGVALVDPGAREPVVACATSLVTFQPLTDETVAWYVATGEPRGKAGAYAIQGLGATLVASVRGSMSNVIGLPVAEVSRLLGLGANRGRGSRSEPR